MNLKDSLIRQAYSMSMQPNSAAFRKFVWDRLVQPERNTQRAIRGKLVGGNATDIEKAMDQMDMKLIHFMHLVSIVKSFRRNRGVTKQHMAQILGVHHETVDAIGRECVELMVCQKDPVEQFLTGLQDYDRNCAPDPGTLHGHRSSVGFIN